MKKNKEIEVWLFWGILVFGILLGAGTISSGVHLVDDHEMIRYSLRIKEVGIIKCIAEVLKKDFSIRFRPLYYIIRIILCSVLGYNYTAWSVLNGITIVIAGVFSSKCALRKGCSFWAACLFSAVILVGPQSVVWWKLGPQESVGIALFMIGFYYLLKWIDSGEKKWGVAATVLFTMVSLYKESFVALLPFTLAYVIFDYVDKNGWSFKNLWIGVRKYKFFIGWILCIGMIEAWVMFFVVGTNSYGDGEIRTLYQYKKIFLESIRGPLKWFTMFGIVMFLLLGTNIRKWRVLAENSILAIIIMIPQFVVYKNCGIEERYIIPWSLGYAWIFVIAGLKEDGILKEIKWRKYLYILCMCSLMIINLGVAWREAKYHTYRGESFQEVWKIVMENTNEESKILAAYSPYTESDLTLTYWGGINGRDYVYSWDEQNHSCTIKWGDKAGTEASVSEMDVILFYSPEHRHYCYEPDIDLNKYEIKKIGTLVICINKDSVIQ